MSIEGFLRLSWPYLLELGVTLLAVWFIARLVLKRLSEGQESIAKSVKFARFCISIAVAIFFAVWFLASVGINLIPRTDIDRRELDQQNQQWEQQYKK